MSDEWRVGRNEKARGGYTPGQQCKELKRKELLEEQQGKSLKTKVQDCKDEVARRRERRDVPENQPGYRNCN
jgi:hypothetical protein